LQEANWQVPVVVSQVPVPLANAVVQLVLPDGPQCESSCAPQLDPFE
jgi:hypothetical protein